MRTTIGMAAMLALVACGGQSPSAPEEAAAQAAAATTVGVEPAAAAPAPSRALDMAFGIIYAGNMMGEIEPCG